MKAADFWTADRRLVLLQGLDACVQYRASTHLLRRFADGMGHAVSADLIDSDLHWLAEQGLLSLDVGAVATVATLTTRGIDVALGRAVVPGVAVPGPRG